MYIFKLGLVGKSEMRFPTSYGRSLREVFSREFAADVVLFVSIRLAARSEEHVRGTTQRKAHPPRRAILTRA